VPFSVISSAVAIPSASGLPHAKKEFIVYESSFSDILGIMFFNFMSTNQHFGLGSFAHLGLETIEILLISVLSCVALLYLLGRIKQRVKFVPIIALLILVYGVSRQWHLPSLVIVFMFGLFLKNIDLIKHPVVNRRLMYEHYHSDIHQLHQLSAESAFLLRTFFFVIFGFTISLTELATPEVLQYGLLAFLLIALIRYAGLRGVLREAPSPEWYLLPRGLISILLYYNIAEPLKISPYESSILLFVVLATNLLMSFGLVRYRVPQANE
jgi:NhaP-type Na+/H+ or K+/H+ antiporter